jgi:hypothetical protein
MLTKRELLVKKANGKKYMQEYLAELNVICTRRITEDQLLSLEETYDIIARIKSHISSESTIKEQINFDEKIKLKHVIDEVKNSFGNGLYLFTEYSKMCGVLYLEDIYQFNSDFNFTAEHAGIISLINKEITFKLVLDFYEEQSQQFLEIEVYKKVS